MFLQKSYNAKKDFWFPCIITPKLDVFEPAFHKAIHPGDGPVIPRHEVG